MKQTKRRQSKKRNKRSKMANRTYRGKTNSKTKSTSSKNQKKNEIVSKSTCNTEMQMHNKGETKTKDTVVEETFTSRINYTESVLETQESSLLFWIKSMCNTHLCVNNMNKEEHRKFNENADKQADSTQNLVNELSSEQTANNTNVEQRSLLQEEKQLHTAPVQQQTTTLLHSQTSSQVRTSEVQPALPLFSAIMNNELGAVVIDVIILGQTSLMRQPQVFAKILDVHTQADSAALRRLLHSVTLFIVSRQHYLYYLDSESTSLVIVLLAHLLASRNVVKAGLHIQLLTRLLLLFLGSDRVCISNFVDLDIWSACMMQCMKCTLPAAEYDKQINNYNEKVNDNNGRNSSYSKEGVNSHEEGEEETRNAGESNNKEEFLEDNVINYNVINDNVTEKEYITKHVQSIDQVYKSLSQPTLQAIDIEVDRMVHWLRVQHMEGILKNNNESKEHNTVSDNDPNNVCTIDSEGNSTNRHGSTNNDHDHGKDINEKLQNEEEEQRQEEQWNEENAVDILARVITKATPIHHNNKSHIKESTSSELTWLTLPQNVEFVTRVYRDLLAVEQWCSCHHVIQTIENNNNINSDCKRNINDYSGMCSKENASLFVSLAERRTQTSVLCAMMTFHGVFVSKQRYDMMQRDVQGQVNELATLGNTLLLESKKKEMESAQKQIVSVEEQDRIIPTVQTKSQRKRRRQNTQRKLQVKLQQHQQQGRGNALLSSSSFSLAPNEKIEQMSADGVMRCLLSHSHLQSSLEKLQKQSNKTQEMESEEETTIQDRQTDKRQPSNVTISHASTTIDTTYTHTVQEIRSILEREGLVGSRKPGETATLQLKRLVERLEQLGVDVQLGVIWLAIQERHAFMKYLSDLFSVDCKLLVRILPSTSISVQSESSHNNSNNNIINSSNNTQRSNFPLVCFSLHPNWQVHTSTTGRVFASFPNMQTLPKLPPTAKYALEYKLSQNNNVANENASNEHINNNCSNNSSGGDNATLPTTRHRSCYNDSNSITVTLSPFSVPMLREHHDWSVRHLCIAPPGCVLVSLDYNQIELRVLAHMSGDEQLIEQLSSGTDVLRAVAHTVLHHKKASLEGNISNNKNNNQSLDKVLSGHHEDEEREEEEEQQEQDVTKDDTVHSTNEEENNRNTFSVSSWQRQAIKVIVYGLIYGMGARSMEEKIAELRQTHSQGEYQESKEEQSNINNSNIDMTDQLSARELIQLFYNAYPQVEKYLRQTRINACSRQCVNTITGSKNLMHITDCAKRRQNSVAWAIQGGAADLLQEAMITIHKHRHCLFSSNTNCNNSTDTNEKIVEEANNVDAVNVSVAPFALMMAAHDELIYAVPSSLTEMVIPQLASIMTGIADKWQLRVPLKVSVRVGDSLGELREIKVERTSIK